MNNVIKLESVKYENFILNIVIIIFYVKKMNERNPNENRFIVNNTNNNEEKTYKNRRSNQLIPDSKGYQDKLDFLRKNLQLNNEILKAIVIYPSGQTLERIDTRQEFPPHGPLIIAKLLQMLGFKVYVLPVHDKEDIRINFKKIINANLIAVSALTSPTYALLRSAIFYLDFCLKNWNISACKKPLRIIGGFHASYFPEITLTELNGDILIQGEGEQILYDLFGKNPKKLEEINGLFWINSDNEIKRPNVHAKKWQNFNKTPFPAFNLLPKDSFLLKNRVPISTNPKKKIGYGMKSISLLCARGCPFNCYFCGSQPEIIRYKKPKKIRDYLLKMIDKYDIDSFVISDETFTMNYSWVENFCEAVEDLGLAWSVTTRVDRLSPKILSRMKKAGCKEIKIGAESGDDRILTSMNKNINVKQLEVGVNMIANEGILVKLLLIHGLPGENLKSTQNTIKFLEKIKKYVHRVTVFSFRPLPGSYIWEHPEEFHLKSIIPDDVSGIHHELNHYWGSILEYEQVKIGRKLLNKYVNDTFPVISILNKEVKPELIQVISK